MVFDQEFIENILSDFFKRSARIKAVGGIALKDVVDGTAVVPVGWVLDEQLFFYIPPHFSETVQ